MKVDAPIYSFDAPEAEVRRLEAKGYAGRLHLRGPARPVLSARCSRRGRPSGSSSTRPSRSRFSRNPMILAQHRLGPAAALEGPLHPRPRDSQISAHIERRFSMPWSHPASRMREMVLAIKAIWRCWQTGERARLPRRVLRSTR